MGTRARTTPPPIGTPIRSNIVRVLTSDKRFTALGNAAAIAGLIPMLMNGESLTLFAPTNDAFRALPPAELNRLIADPERMKKVLLGHVTTGKIPSRHLRSGEIRFVNDEVGRVVVSGNGITIGGALIVQNDIPTFDGMIHAIDRLIVPEPPPTILKVLTSDRRFSTFVRAVSAAGLFRTLDTAESVTLFAPTNEAFNALPPGMLDRLLSNPKKLKKMIMAHMVSGKIMGRDLRRGDTRVVSGPAARMILSRSGGRIPTARVTQADIQASNGVVHVIDKVI